MSTAKKNVVLVGGGGAGVQLASSLSQQLDATKYNLILISARPYYVHLVAGIRLVVTAKDNLEDQMLIPYDKLFTQQKGQFKQGTVTAIKAKRGSRAPGRVVLEGGETVDFDVLVLSPGSKWESFLNFPADHGKMQAHIEKWRETFRDAKKIAIAGGGAIGIELAGELRDFHPDKLVTIVHGDKQLLNGTYPDKFRKDVERRVRTNKVRLVLDDFIDSFPATETRKGVPLDAELVVPAQGPRPNTSFIVDSLGEDVANERGYVRISPTMQLQNYPSIFAMGDIIEYPEQKQIGKYGGHASVVAANVLSMLKGQEPKKQYKGTFEAIFITFGRNGGAGFFGVLWGLMFGNWIVSLVKSKGLFISMWRKNLKY